MIRINLLPLKEAEREAGRRRERVIGTGAVLAVLLLMVFFGLQQTRVLGRARAKIAGLNSQLAALNTKNKEAVQLEAMRKQAREKLKTIADLDKRRVGPVQILKDLSEAIPAQAWLTEFSDSGGSATITGRALDNQTVAMFARRLSNSEYFVEVDPVETTQMEDEGVKLKKFVLKTTLAYFGNEGSVDSSEPEATLPQSEEDAGT